MGVFMKRFLCLCMCIFIITISVLTYFPICAYAADDFTLSTVEGGNISSDEANRAVNNKGDIYNANHEILFRYTPTSDYNWTYVNWDVHCSDAQVVACLRSNNKFEAFGALLKAGVSHNAFSRVMLSQLGFLVSENSELGTDFLDRLTENYNYLNAIEYDSSTGDLTLLADQVSALRKELKERYYLSNGMLEFKSSGETAKSLSGKRKYYEEEEDFLSDSADIRSYQCAFAGDDNGNYWTWDVAVGFNRDYSYAYFSPVKDDKYSYNVVFVNPDLTMCDLSFKTYLCGYYYYRDGNADNYRQFDLSCNRAVKFNGMYLSTYSEPNFFNFTYSFNKLGYSFYRKNNNSDTELASFSASSNPCYFYSNDNKPFIIFKSYEAMYNFAYGSQTAYLSSKVEEAGEDIKLSINDMNDNIGSKIDDLIDGINNKKDGMSADELQDAIDKALDSISGKIDNIGDNTEETNNKLDSLLSLMSEQNNILLQILGVTEYIAYNNTKEDGSDYTTDDLKNTFNTMYDGVRNAILYGTNTVSNSGAAVSVAAYSSEDLATQDINNLDIHNGLFGKFPFSIPYQLYEWLQVLEAEPVAPVFNYNYGFMIGKKNNPDCNLTIDLSVYEPWANQAKSFERLLFTLLMAVFIYKKFKGNSIF